MSNAALRVLLLGDTLRAEMRSAVDWVRTSFRDGVRTASLEESLAMARGGEWYPDFVVVFQSWPLEFPRQGVLELLWALGPARWVVCSGAWCESDGRNHDVWPQALRVSVRRAVPRLQAELEVLQGRRPAGPLTASRDEVFEFQAQAGRELPWDSPVAIDSHDREYAALLAELVTSAGGRTLSGESWSDAACVLFDVDPWTAGRRAEWTAVRERAGGASMIGLAGLAHPELGEELAGLGAAQVIDKLELFV